MDQIYGLKQKWLMLYSKTSLYIQIILKFVLGFIVYSYINNQLGYMGMLDNTMIVLLLSAVGSVMSYTIILLIATFLILLHCFSASIGLVACVGIVFLILYIIYFRFTSKMAIVVLVTPLALQIGVPIVVPIVGGLLLNPFASIPMIFGSFIYIMLQTISGLSETWVGELSLDGLMSDGLGILMALKDNKEIIFYAIVLSVTICVVYLVKKLPITHAWKISIGVGYLTYFIMAFFTGGILAVEVSIVGLIFGNLIAVLIGLFIEIMFMGVDYKKTEIVEFEDDDYHYYVKAVPKIKGVDFPIIAFKSNEIDDEYEEAMDETNYSPDEAYEQDKTMILDTEDIERELRRNAQQSAVRTQRRNARHSKANYRMLKEDMNPNIEQEQKIDTEFENDIESEED